MADGHGTACNLLQQILIIWGFIGPIAAFVLAIFVRRWHIRYQMRVNEAIQFRCAFIPEICLLRSTIIKHGPDGNLANEVVKGALAKHENAVLRFSVVLPKRKSKELLNLWKEYSCQEDVEYWQEVWGDHATEEPFTCYKPEVHSDTAELEMRKLALKCIDKMFKIV